MIVIKAERLFRGWSQAELARRAHMNPTTVSLIEAGRLVPYPSQLRKLERALGLKPSELELTAPQRTNSDHGADNEAPA